MPTSLVVALGLLTMSASPYGGYTGGPTAPRRMPASQPPVRAAQAQELVPPGEMDVDAYASDGSMSYEMGNPASVDGCPCNGCDCRGRGGLPCCWTGTCNLFPHVPYYVEPKTYYYFRPYNYMHVNQQRLEAMRWGMDARHPYANEVFKEVYGEVEADSGMTAPDEASADRDDAEPSLGQAERTSATMPDRALEERLIRFLDHATTR